MASGRTLTTRVLLGYCGLIVALALWRYVSLLTHLHHQVTMVNYIGHMSPTRNILPPKNNSSVLLYITTHFSQQHIRYFQCCWPILVQHFPLISHAHIVVAATNTSPVDDNTLRYLSDTLFARNPSYRLGLAPDNRHQQRCDQYKNQTLSWKRQRQWQNASDSSLILPVNYKQCTANEGFRMGLEHGWIFDQTGVDWIVRLNPDVLIRNATMLESLLSSSTLEGLFLSCGPKTRQLHTDFFAIRRRFLQANKDSFSVMAKKAGKLNAERTAYREFLGRNSKTNISYQFVPEVEPSQGNCRARGARSPIYHVHDSCLSTDDMKCSALDGWI